MKTFEEELNDLLKHLYADDQAGGYVPLDFAPDDLRKLVIFIKNYGDKEHKRGSEESIKYARDIVSNRLAALGGGPYFDGYEECYAEIERIDDALRDLSPRKD